MNIPGTFRRERTHRRFVFSLIFLCFLHVEAQTGGRDSRTPDGRGVIPDTAETARILSFLAADELRGRGSFTPESERASDFIAGEFRSAGLSPLKGEDSIGIRFTVNRTRPVSVRVSFNGAVLPDTEVIVSTREVSVEIDRPDSLPLIRMGETFDRSMMRRGDGIVLIPRSHAPMFRRYRRFMSGPRISMDAPEPGVFVAVLTDLDTVTALDVRYSGAADTPGLVDVVGVLPGRREAEIVLFSAHYDHLGVVSPVGGDSIANGANDNASGTTALIALAKYFRSLGTPERTLVFAAFAAEEIGGFGSRFLAGKVDPGTIVAMVNLEMLGTVSKFGPNSFWITGYDRGELGPMVSDALVGTGYSAHPDPYPDENLFFRSDNASFARVGVPAHSFSTDPIDIDSVYHTVDDEIERLDIGHLAGIVKGIALGIGGIVDGRQTPARLENSGK